MGKLNKQIESENKKATKIYNKTHPLSEDLEKLLVIDRLVRKTSQENANISGDKNVDLVYFFVSNLKDQITFDGLKSLISDLVKIKDFSKLENFQKEYKELSSEFSDINIEVYKIN